MKKIYCLLAIITGTIALNSCQKFDFKNFNDHQNNASTFNGPEVQMGSGHARSWITIGKTGVPIQIGVEMTDEVLYGLPDVSFSVALPLHNKAKETTPFDHLYITWAAHGHPLPGTFIAPHFDVRFFMTGLDEQLAIPTYAADPTGFDNHPPTGYMPASYFANAPSPQLGVHWTDGIYDNPVTKAMILGSYNGKFTFVSPIMILDILQSGQSSSTPYAQPQYFAKHTYYPTKYNIYMDNTSKKHYITLSDFVWR
ncbi:MAG: DUF5602 domain-containing protein [Bacteroidota bacterium]|nr:DUF5602 domain-containing protein [Bacteroidota bacterium]